MVRSLPQVGDYVKVEADRGEDLGMVVHTFPVPEAGRPLPVTAGQKRGFGQFEKEHIIRAATEDEVRASQKQKKKTAAYCCAVCVFCFGWLFLVLRTFGLGV